MSATTPQQQALIHRVHALLATESNLREVSMFGGHAIMVNNKIIVSVGKDGCLLVRVNPEKHDCLLAEPGASQATMGKDRTMGAGWITVAEDALIADQRLAFWVNTALAYNRALHK